MLADRGGTVGRDLHAAGKVGDAPLAGEGGRRESDAEQEQGPQLAFSIWHLALSTWFAARLNRLRENSEFSWVRVELAFRPASKPFLFCSSRL